MGSWQHILVYITFIYPGTYLIIDILGKIIRHFRLPIIVTISENASETLGLAPSLRYSNLKLCKPALISSTYRPAIIAKLNSAIFHISYH